VLAAGSGRSVGRKFMICAKGLSGTTKYSVYSGVDRHVDLELAW